MQYFKVNILLISFVFCYCSLLHFLLKIFNVLIVIDMPLIFLLHVDYLLGFIMVLHACLFCHGFLFFLCIYFPFHYYLIAFSLSYPLPLLT